MENLDNELRKVVQELADEEGISFADAVDVSIKTLQYEIQRRKSFNGSPAPDGGASGVEVC
ncbi:hypothetical protein ACYA5G_05275 [Klebsiella pneumoniae]|uniref:hypothetical protein n=1 Tax=Klebsiella pneumoniae TaxID=573 RepID=UPI001CF24192|nr:hypothetical protein [Klebsiella pneumoniae]MCA6701579.1 hypothetical protein [Klebsiella pneumoniae]